MQTIPIYINPDAYNDVLNVVLATLKAKDTLEGKLPPVVLNDILKAAQRSIVEMINERGGHVGLINVESYTMRVVVPSNDSSSPVIQFVRVTALGDDAYQYELCRTNFLYVARDRLALITKSEQLMRDAKRSLFAEEEEVLRQLVHSMIARRIALVYSDSELHVDIIDATFIHVRDLIVVKYRRGGDNDQIVIFTCE